MNEPFVYSLEPEMCSVDFMGRWQPGSIFRAMQEAGEGHCRLLRLTFEELRRLGLAWVLTRAHVQMDEYPRLGQKVTVRTWPGATRHTFFPRYYTFESDGRAMGRASVLYVLLDLETRKIAPPSRLEGEIPGYDLPAPLPFPGAIRRLEGESRSVSYTPVYTDFDMNGHVNNTRYIDWYMNLFPYEKHERETLRDLLVHYHYEIRPEESLLFQLCSQGNTSVMQGMSGDRACFAIEGTWRSRAPESP